MERILKFRGLTGRYNTSSFFFAENEPLIIRFEFTERRIGNYIATIACGDKKKTVALDKNREVEVSPDFIADGGFEPLFVHLSFLNTIGDKVIIGDNPAKGGFFVEPLYIMKTGESTTGQAWLTRVEGIIADLTARVEAAESKLKQYQDNGLPVTIEEN